MEEIAQALLALSTRTQTELDYCMAQQLNEQMNPTRVRNQRSIFIPDMHPASKSNYQAGLIKTNDTLSPTKTKPRTLTGVYPLEGEYIAIYWAGDKQYYSGRVLEYLNGDEMVIGYDDGEFFVERFQGLKYKSLSKQAPETQLRFTCTNDQNREIEYVVPAYPSELCVLKSF